MNLDPELPLYPPTVFRETLWGPKFFARMEELKNQGAKIETMERSKEGNAVWEIVYRINPERAGV